MKSERSSNATHKENTLCETSCCCGYYWLHEIFGIFKFFPATPQRNSLPLGIKWPRDGTEHLLLPSSEVKNEWSFTSSCPIYFNKSTNQHLRVTYFNSRGLCNIHIYMFLRLLEQTINFRNSINQPCFCNKEVMCSVNIMIFCSVTPCCLVGRFRWTLHASDSPVVQCKSHILKSVLRHDAVVSSRERYFISIGWGCGKRHF